MQPITKFLDSLECLCLNYSHRLDIMYKEGL
jgi:hypothetical protein